MSLDGLLDAVCSFTVLGPHRSSTFVEQCNDCATKAVDVCFRCNRPWCEAHASLDMDLCRDCDRQWITRKLKIESNWDAEPIVEVVVGLGFVVLVAAIALQSLGPRLSVIPIMLGMTAGWPVGNLAGRLATRVLSRPLTRRLHQQRSRFLGDRPEVALLGVTTSMPPNGITAEVGE